MATATARIQVIIEAAEKAAAGIIDDAEAQARRYLEESRTRADSIADQRAQEMSALTDSLIQQAETVKRQSDELIQALDQAKQQVHERFGEEPALPVEPAPIHHLKPVEPQADFPIEALPPQAADLPLEEASPQTGAEPLPMPPPVSVPPPSSEPAASVEEPVAPEEPSLVSGPPAHESAPPPPPAASRPAGAPPSDGARLLATQMAVAGSSRAEIESRLQNEFGIWDAGPMLDAILGREG